MAASSKIKIMISSRCDDVFPAAGGTRLSDIRRQLRRDIEATEIFGKKSFEVWINEESPPKGGAWDSWDTCLEAVSDCDILLVLSNGHAGWGKARGDIGICHAEYMTALSKSPGKVWYISLGNTATGDAAQTERNRRFQDYASTQSAFRGGTVATMAELITRVNEALQDAIITLTRNGVREASRGKFHSGQALDWNRLDFAARQKEMARIIRESLLGRSKAIDKNPAVVLSISGDPILFVPAAIPAAITVSQAREMVGQPFLRDHEHNRDLTASKAAGPVHLIACHKGVTEAQAIRLLGFPDATVVATPFGVYVADDIQKIQMVLIANCRDEATTRHGIQRFFDWIDQTNESDRLAKRAQSRRNIVKAIYDETASASTVTPAASKTPPKKKRA